MIMTRKVQKRTNVAGTNIPKKVAKFITQVVFWMCSTVTQTNIRVKFRVAGFLLPSILVKRQRSSVTSKAEVIRDVGSKCIQLRVCGCVCLGRAISAAQLCTFSFGWVDWLAPPPAREPPEHQKKKKKKRKDLFWCRGSVTVRIVCDFIDVNMTV